MLSTRGVGTCSWFLAITSQIPVSSSVLGSGTGVRLIPISTAVRTLNSSFVMYRNIVTSATQFKALQCNVKATTAKSSVRAFVQQ